MNQLAWSSKLDKKCWESKEISIWTNYRRNLFEEAVGILAYLMHQIWNDLLDLAYVQHTLTHVRPAFLNKTWLIGLP